MLKREFTTDLACAQEFDRNDPLKEFKDRFYPLEDGKINMDGNSLGQASKDAEASLLHVVDVWKKQGIDIWGAEDSKFFLYCDFIAELLAPLIGADADEVAVTGTTTQNIHQALATFYKPTKDKYKILVDDLNFPTDRYAVDSMVRLKGLEPEDAVKIVKSTDGKLIDEDAVIEAMTPDVALVLLPAVLYRSAQLLDMEKVTNAAREKGIIIGWDLCHSVGSVPHDFKKIDPDFAIWCNYKYLSGGPGATGGLYINRRHFDKRAGLNGWFGNKRETQFQLKHEYEQGVGAAAYQTGTCNMLSMAPLEGALRIYQEAGMDRIREKSLHITAYFMYLIDEKLTKYGYSVGNPRDDEKRGGHVCLEHEEAYRICQALKANKVIPDFREPNVIRVAPVALYLSYEEVYKVVEILEKIAVNKEWEQFSDKRTLVV